jgi:hypothetical protein
MGILTNPNEILPLHTVETTGDQFTLSNKYNNFSYK